MINIKGTYTNNWIEFDLCININYKYKYNINISWIIMKRTLSQNEAIVGNISILSVVKIVKWPITNFNHKLRIITNIFWKYKNNNLIEKYSKIIFKKLITLQFF